MLFRSRRNRMAFASVLIAVTFVVCITTFAILMTIQSQRIARERDQAEQERQQAEKVSRVALNVVAIADPFENFGNDVSGSTLLEQAAKSIERELSDQPAPRARLLHALGRVYVRRGDFRSSIAHMRTAVREFSEVKGADSEALMAIAYLTFALRMSGDFQGARQAAVDGHELAERRGLEHTAAYARLLLDRGFVEFEELYGDRKSVV